MKNLKYKLQKEVLRVVIVSIACFLIFSGAAFAATGCDGAGNCYILSTATGSGNGASWTNAYTGFGTSAKQINPASMARGVTYWVAIGSYGAQTFSTPVSGTSLITIEAATAANHGPASDWNSADAGQALFDGVTTFSSSYWTVNGQTRGSDWRSGYLIKFNNNGNGGANGTLMISASNVTVEYVEVEGSNGNYSGSASDDGIWYPGGMNNEYIGYSWIHDAGTDLINFFTGTGETIEYNMIERNHTGLNANHSQALSMGDLGVVIVRYNYFRDITNTGIWDTDNSGGTLVTPQWYFYGNTIYWTTSVHLSSGTTGLSTDSGIGIFGGEQYRGGVIQIYNNDVANINGPSCNNAYNCSEVMLFVSGTGEACHTSCTVITIYNNLWWNPASGGDYAAENSPPWTITGDYGQFYCPVTGCSYGGGYALSGHDVGSNTGNPFVDFDAVTNFNFELNADTSPGLALSASQPIGCTSGINCFNIDSAGVTRAVDGTWDRGAFQHTVSITYGDLNGAANGAVTIYDAELVAQYVVGLIILTPTQIQESEVSSTTETAPTIYDAFLIAEYSVGLITKFPVQS